MEIEKTLLLDAPPTSVWALLLDPVAMGACVPGMESVDVISVDEYVAVMKVKIAFISARFKLKTRITERDEPRYLRAEGTGEDASVASSLKQVSEMWLDERDDGSTALRLKVAVDVLGRMGTFGLGVMKTKADRLWDEFGVNAAARLCGSVTPMHPVVSSEPGPVATSTVSPPTSVAVDASEPSLPPVVSLVVDATSVAASVAPHVPGFWARLFGAPAGGEIRVEVRRGDMHISVNWPTQAAPECVAWLRELTR